MNQSERILPVLGAAAGIMFLAFAVALTASCRGSDQVAPEGSTITLAANPATIVLVGGSGKVFSTSEKFAPRLFDRMKEATSFHGQLTDRPARTEDTLFHPRPDDGRVRGGHPGHVMKTSAYTEARLHRGKALLGLAVLGAGLFVAKRARH